MDAGKTCVVLAKASRDPHAECNHAAIVLLSRKKYVYRINLHFIKRVYVLNKTITFTFGNGKKINLWIKDAYAPFTTLTRALNELIRQRQLELRRERIQRQIHRIEQMHQAWVEPVELEENALDLD